jgi:protein CpxP
MNIRSVRFAVLAGLLYIVPLSTSEAQGRPGGEQGIRGERGQGRQNRQQLEQNFRRRLANLLKTELRLTDDQMRQLSDVNQRFDVQRRDLMRREMQTRRGVRDEVVKGDSANAGRIEQLLADQFRIERERIDLTEAEQRELGKFLTPVQRARYLGVQEQIRRQMDDLRGRRAGPMDMPNDSGRRRRPPGG